MYIKTVLLNNRYQILQTLGRGGFGETYLASDTYMPSGRKCVIKQLKPAIEESGMQQEALKRFQQEAAILEQLGAKHPQIPRLYASFSEAGSFYLVQEWIEGVTLKQKLQQEGPLSEAKVRDILTNLLPVLDFVHSRRIVHRDVKPENIILRHGDGQPVLIDFGAVRAAIATVVNLDGKTAFSVAIGTPGYMPSEQAAGRPVYSSDLYSLGLTAVYLLTGESPHLLETDPRTGEILWHQVAPNFNSNLAAVIDRAIRFHPRDRFFSAQEMLAALRSPSVTATATTLAISQGNLSSTSNSAQPALNEETVAITGTSIPENNWFKWIVLVLLLGGVSAGSGIALGLWRDGRLFPQTASVPDFRENNPQNFPRSEFPESGQKPLPQSQQNPSPTTELPELRSETTPELPEAEPEMNPTPPPVSPSPEPESPSPQPSPEPNSSRMTGIPIFRLGTSESEILAGLGKPSSQNKGYWPNTQAWLYQDYIPNQVDLGYIFDVNTGKLRQIEVSFAQSVSLELQQKTLSTLLGGNTPSAIAQGLTEIYNRENDLRSFNLGNVKGIINRNNKDWIYIGVWEADFH